MLIPMRFGVGLFGLGRRESAAREVSGEVRDSPRATPWQMGTSEPCSVPLIDAGRR